MPDSDELIKNAGRFFKKLGGQIEKAAKTTGTQVKQTAKQVTGLGRGSVKLELDQTKASPSGSIHGRVVLALSEPVDAKRVYVTLRARQKLVTVRRDSGSRSVGTTHADVYEFDLELGGVKRYESETISFELTVPPDALDLKASAPTTPLGEAVRTVASALSPSAGPIEWQVISTLEIAWGRNLTSAVDIVVTQ